MELKKIIFAIAITMAFSIALTMKALFISEEALEADRHHSNVVDDASASAALPIMMPSKRVSRFLQENSKNPRAADHCHKDNEICNIIGRGSKNHTITCCNNKCIDITEDKNNCGGCKKKCPYTHQCCRGQCVRLDVDKRHCGKCNNPCRNGEVCVYSMCSYA